MGGPVIRIQNKKSNSSRQSKKSKTIKIQQIISILKFCSTSDDKEIILSSIESVIEMLEEIS